MKLSWVTIDRFCQEEADAKEDVRRELERTGRPLRSSADPLSDDELLAKLRNLGVDVDGDGVERLCAGALSAEEVAGPIVDKLELSDMTVDWVRICVLALWQRWWPDRVCLDGRQDAGRLRPGRGEQYARGRRDLAERVVRRAATVRRHPHQLHRGVRRPLPPTQSLFNWIQDLEMALENAGRDDREMLQALIDFCEE